MQQPTLVLWRSVLLAGLDDARRSAAGEEWIWSRDFELVCMFARVDPGAVRCAFYRQMDKAADSVAAKVSIPRCGHGADTRKSVLRAT